jgi:hypothetical protein
MEQMERAFILQKPNYERLYISTFPQFTDFSFFPGNWKPKFLDPDLLFWHRVFLIFFLLFASWS